ncbi:MAG: geranylgeranylglyceryl/heptaprenylglyceryl phosphate synthase [Vicingaceae bacterium]
METTILNRILKSKEQGKKQLAILIDPDKANHQYLTDIAKNAEDLSVDLFLVGGSLLTDGDLEQTISTLKSISQIPIVIFPGSSNQISAQADAILFLSLLSSRNPEMLIGKQVIAAPYIKKSKLEAISTAYLLIDSGAPTTASYMSNSNPIPANKAEIAASTALAGEYMGMNLIYLDGGSGAKNTIPPEMIKKVREYTTNPIIIGGGINSVDKLNMAYEAGADMVVIGNAFETQADFAQLLKETRSSLHSV